MKASKAFGFYNTAMKYRLLLGEYIYIAYLKIRGKKNNTMSLLKVIMRLFISGQTQAYLLQCVNLISGYFQIAFLWSAAVEQRKSPGVAGPAKTHTCGSGALTHAECRPADKMCALHIWCTFEWR